MSNKRDLEIVVDIIKATALVAPLAVESVKQVLAAARPDLRIAEAPPEGQYAPIVAEDEPILRRRYGGKGAKHDPEEG